MMLFHLFLAFSTLFEIDLLWLIKVVNFEQLINAEWHFASLFSAKYLCISEKWRVGVEDIATTSRVYLTSATLEKILKKNEER
jgi:hypothetical protein